MVFGGAKGAERGVMMAAWHGHDEEASRQRAIKGDTWWWSRHVVKEIRHHQRDGNGGRKPRRRKQSRRDGP